MQATESVNVLQSATGFSSQPPTRTTSDASAGGREKTETPLIKQQRFDGHGSLDAFLLQFKQLSEYRRWCERDRRYHLGASLSGPAGQVLTELPATGSTTAQVIQLLQSKFGTKLQAESFQAKLKARRRKEGEQLQDLYRDVSRLLQLAYPGKDARSTERTGINAFIAALNDGPMEFEVMKCRPKTLQEAADYATKLEAFAETVRNRPAVSAERKNSKVQVPGRPCAIFRTAVESDSNGTKESSLLERIGQLEKQLEQVTNGNRDAQGSSPRKASSGKKGAGRGQSTSGNESGRRPSPETHPCNYCQEMGHWCRDCPKHKAKGQEEQEEKQAGVQTVLAVNSSMSPTKVHVTAEINGEPVRCLLDSGCERSVINAALVSNVELSPSEYTLYAANRASLDVIGDCVISFVIDGHNFEADVSVSHKVDEFLLGGDWLEKNNAKWDFADGTVTLGGRKIQAHRGSREGICRRIVVAHDCVVPARHEANIAVRMEADNILFWPVVLDLSRP